MGWCILRISVSALILVSSTLAETYKEVAVSGGQLRGKTIPFENTTVDLFLGVRYAQPPVGDLRFKKPQAVLPWNGAKNALVAGSRCPQFLGLLDGAIGIGGDEDCLFLDITVPGGTQPGSKKPVMVWIHGGGYTAGEGSTYYGAPLAVHGDVIVVTINYRLGVLGFLSDGPGTGNYGIWDQRQALLWVKENIDKFGGDPDMVTIFGESAGAASVSAQVMGRLNDGLFKRAIQQSGSLYPDWGWWLSMNQRYELVKKVREQLNCGSDGSVYDCFKGMTATDILTKTAPGPKETNVWHPVPDNDFFSENITDESYDLASRFDILAGFNGQEGGLVMFQDILNNYPGQNITGYTIQMAKKTVTDACSLYLPLSVRLCVNFIMDTYQLESAPNDQERGIRLSYFLGEASFNADVYRQLMAHSSSSMSTYAYTFTQLYQPPPSQRLWATPDWVKVSADHVDEIPFVWGMLYAQKCLENLTAAYGFSQPAGPLYGWVSEKDKLLTDVMMTSWTNFAKTGNPNQPVALPEGTPVWPQFSSDEFMEFNSNRLGVISTPNKNRLDSLISVFFSARSKQSAADKAPVKAPCPTATSGTVGKDVVIG